MDITDISTSVLEVAASSNVLGWDVWFLDMDMDV